MKLLRAPKLLTGRPDEVLLDAEVLVDGELIKGVGVRGSQDADGAELVELEGCTLMPGMVDAHVHLGFDRNVDPLTKKSTETDSHLLLRMAENARKLLSAGVTTARDLGGRDFLEVELRDAIEAGLAVGPHLVVATRPITNTGGHCWYMGGEADDAESIRRVARENLRAGADCLKVMATGGTMTPVGPPTWHAQFGPGQIRVAVEEAAMRGKLVAAHAHGTAGIKNATEAGVRTIEHCSFAVEGAPTPFARELDMDVVASIAERGVYVCPTLNSAAWHLDERYGPGTFDNLVDRLAKMRAAGVKLIAGTDCGFAIRGVENRMDAYVRGLELFAAAGWDNASVIEAATTLAAQAIGLGEVTGSLDAGKRADLIAVRGDPLAHLADLHNLELVMVSGRCVTQSQVDTAGSSVWLP
ncbi:MAG: amidohydrolase family protein [Actinomycetota bacterium]|jgi:imidazolonepropionase-like amidohydrolase|nr:amidohydrolase family protein [Actinomycetota bacterium]